MSFGVEVAHQVRGLAAALLVVISLTLAGAALEAQEAESRTATVTLGVGNSMGWLGGQGEYYLAQGRISLFAGLGYTPDWDDNRSGLAAAGGIRGYTAGSTHRGFLEASVSQIAVQRGSQLSPGTESYYGPALLAGYQYTSTGGFTAIGSAGAGYLLDDTGRTGQSDIQLVLNLGIGYTWH